MGRSDSSLPLRPQCHPCRAGSDTAFGLCRSKRGLPRSRTSLLRPSRRQSRNGFLCGASPSRAGWPTRPAESRSLSFGARLWLGPFPAHLTTGGCRCLRERTLTQVLPAGLEPARYVRCEAHTSVHSDTRGARPHLCPSGHWFWKRRVSTRRVLACAAPPWCPSGHWFWKRRVSTRRIESAA